ncbi:MAG: glycoside hydrolase family 95 protein [Ruminococcus sp.]|nr:glycoside hydrolase family 95 protein [Ruminococcus sp.]
MSKTFSNKTIWFDQPTEDWNTALPVGNGRIGAMVFGQPLCERLQLNEDSVWSGGYRKRNNISALGELEKVRQLLREERIPEAEAIVNEAFCGTPVNQRHYMPLGDMSIEHTGVSECEYGFRSLDVENAVCVTEYTADGVSFRREVICSNPAQVLAVRISASQKGKVDLKIGMDGRDDYFDDNSPVSDTDILYYGGCGSEDGINFAAFVRVIGVGGKVRAYGSKIVTTGCDEVVILLGAQTSYRTQDYKNAAVLDVEEAASKSFEELMEEHIKDHRSYFDRAAIELEDNSDGGSQLPTNERLAQIRQGKKDNLLSQLYFDFGRYLMIAGSREGTLPLNLQGIWNKDMWPAWGCRFTININTEMNYWPAEICNLSELHTPLFDHIERMRPNGRITAKEMYNAQGFVCHHNTDIWGDTAPQDLWIPGTQWPMGAAWLCTHIWQHYLFTLDKDFLAQKYETLKEASRFFTDFLMENDLGQLVTSPSVSPENTYITSSGTKGSVCMGPSMDSQIIYELFTSVIEGSRILDIDKAYREKLIAMRDKLPKPEIGKYGQIKEWAVDYDEAEPGHRHISQLFALYPSDMISVRKTPELADAARATIERRLSYGGGHTGWSRAWIINHWARLFDGEKVEENIRALLDHSTSDNLFDMHPPFQIDGNFGAAAGMAEALLNSTGGELVLLPALCPSWDKGSFKALRARGGFTVSCRWENSKAISCEISADVDNTCRLVMPGGASFAEVKCHDKAVSCERIGDTLVFEAAAGRTYEIIFN